METCLLPETNDVMLVSAPEPMRFPWRFLFDSVSHEHRTPAEVEGLCFKTLVLGAQPTTRPVPAVSRCCCPAPGMTQAVCGCGHM